MLLFFIVTLAFILLFAKVKTIEIVKLDFNSIIGKSIFIIISLATGYGAKEVGKVVGYTPEVTQIQYSDTTIVTKVDTIYIPKKESRTQRVMGKGIAQIKPTYNRKINTVSDTLINETYATKVEIKPRNKIWKVLMWGSN